ncbi:lytic transglycosylase domain-containing protein [Granulicella sp. L46]|uniref:lytic transglycosylase domain-containing protein n=1 Tax=Granulicella sp. L46 TaxID=1641865 RepID=UPI00131D75C9|nr:lytic transglycosylase domain-containing protein [Granulicella sp. L46]
MPTSKTTSLIRRSLAVTSSLFVLLTLTGCPDTRSRVAAPSSAPANTTAPTLQQQKVTTQAQTQAQQSANQIMAAQHAQRVQALIAKTEASYQSGVANYHANHLDAARHDFDAAVDTMLSSGMDLKTDPQLSDEFDQLLSAINSLEMVALKQGNGFSGQLEEAPAEAANEVTFPSNPELVGKIAAELKTTHSDLPLVVNDYVAGWISYFSNNPNGHAHLVRSLERAGKYQAMISKTLSDQGVPQDLIYLAVAESGFQPQAMNGGSGAGGMWQFMPQGGYGLERNGYFDERFDPQKSTLAYAKYMKSLYNQFGDWYLAMAAYDWGPGRIQHAVAKTGYADYWELYRRNALPGETKAYVPSIIAAAIMAKNPKQYGLTDVVPDAPILSDDVTINYAIDMRLVADLTNATIPEIVALNPALLRLTTPNDIPYDLHLPPGTRDMFLTRLKNIPEADRTTWRFHVVQNGETLDQIAESLHAHAAEITSFNDITDPIEAGDELVIPIAASSRLTPGERYTMRRNDTLVTVADRFGVTVEQLRAWNHLSSNRVAPGHALYVVEPIRLAPATREHRHHAGSTSSHNSSAKHHGAAEERSSSHSASHAHTTNNEKKKSKKKKGSK